MAGFTESHEVALLVAAALGEREDVVYLFGRCERSLLLTLFTERMELDVAVTDAFPGTTVSFIGIGVAFVPVVLSSHFFLMLGAVLLAVCKPTAAGVSTGTLWFVGHGFTSPSGHKEKPPQISPQWPLEFYFSIVMVFKKAMNIY
jgi:hypothetical protein